MTFTHVHHHLLRSRPGLQRRIFRPIPCLQCPQTSCNPRLSWRPSCDGFHPATFSTRPLPQPLLLWMWKLQLLFLR
jgi:hypothetical protein